MTRIPLHRLIIAGAICLTATNSPVQAEDASPRWDGIQRLQVDLTSTEAPPFLQLAAPRLGEQQDPGVQLAGHEVHQHEATAKTVDPVTANRHELRDSLVREGKESLEGRDHLAGEVVGMVKWTVMTIVLGSLAAVGLKKYQLRPTSGAAGPKIKVLETMHLGRQQGLKLVEVGGERFLIASDQSGIKAVTLLPNWSAAEEEQEFPRMNAEQSMQKDSVPQLYREEEEIQRAVS